MSYTERAIGEALHVSQQTVSQDIQIIRRRNARRYETLLDPQARMKSLYVEIEKKLRRVERELWGMFYGCKADNYQLKNSILQTLRATVNTLAERMEVVAPSLTEKYLTEALLKWHVEEKKLRQDMEELQLKNLVTPIPGMPRHPWNEEAEKTG